MPYLVADGHDVLFASLAAIAPQPQGDPAAPVQRAFGISMVPHDQGKFAVWRWTSLASESAYLTVLTTLGLHNADYNDVTIYTRSERMLWTMYNARAIFPQMGTDARWSQYFPRDISVTFQLLEVLI